MPIMRFVAEARKAWLCGEAAISCGFIMNCPAGASGVPGPPGVRPAPPGVCTPGRCGWWWCRVIAALVGGAPAGLIPAPTHGAASTCRVSPTLSGCARGGHDVEALSLAARSLNTDDMPEARPEVIPEVMPDGNPDEAFCRHCSCRGGVPARESSTCNVQI